MNVLVISAHPDDETLGCGGTILKHIAAGDTVSWIVATQVFQPNWPVEIAERKAVEVQAVARAYGMGEVFKLGFPTVRLDAIPQFELIEKLRPAVVQTQPAIVYLVHGGDIHTDHFALFNAVMSVLKPFHLSKFGVRRVLSYETVSSTDQAPPLPHRAFLPNAFSDISAWIDRKLEIMALFETEAQSDPLPRGPGAIRALARLRGATIGVQHAEAFMVLRDLF